MNDSSPPLEIPEASVQALLAEQDDWGDYSELPRAVRDIAAPVVAAELRRIADDGTGWAIGTHLRRRADELDPQGRRVEQAADSWFAPAIPVLPPTGGVRVRRARPDGPDDV